MSKLLLIAALLFSSNSFAGDHVKQTNKFILFDGTLINTDSIAVYDGRTLILTSGAKIALSGSPTDVKADIYASTKDYEIVQYSK